MQICENEDSDVPNFIVRAIRAIEARGILFSLCITLFFIVLFPGLSIGPLTD